MEQNDAFFAGVNGSNLGYMTFPVPAEALPTTQRVEKLRERKGMSPLLESGAGGSIGYTPSRSQ